MKINIPHFAKGRLLVLGDLMLDRYWHGPTSRISPEAPVPVVKVNEIEERPGGAGNVALNLATLGLVPRLMGVTGDDDAAQSLEKRLSGHGIQCDFTKLSDCPTITKLRVMSRHQQLMRLDFEEDFACFDTTGLQHDYNLAVDDYQVIVLSDYGKGTLSDPQPFIQSAIADGKKVLIDPKGSDFARYRGATLITPNQGEFEAVVGPCASDEELVSKGEKLREELELDALLITRSERGMTLIEVGKPALHLPTQAREVFDVTGAGDTVIALLAAGLSEGMSLVEATALANLGAGVVVGKLGTATVTSDELRHAARELYDVEQGIVSEERLIELVRDAKAHGEKVVLTNGCFDILHAGHVTYLQQARLLGDRLIVAVNDDDSVKRIKGPERPVNTMERRMQVLAGLSCVDWVVPFFEDTPTRLICDTAPDILVKGGDNNPDDIPGGECVREQGGEVLVMDYVDNCSTTGLIRSIRSADKSVESKTS